MCNSLKSSDSNDLCKIGVSLLVFQAAYADYIYSYAEKNVEDLKRREGPILNSCFWVTIFYSYIVHVNYI